MTDRDFYARVFADAADRMGGHEALAAALDVDIEALLGWASGRARPPTEVVLRIVDEVSSNAPRQNRKQP